LSGVAFDAILANAGISGDLTRPVDAIDLEEMIRVFDTNISGRCF
jgi:NADP-dependent 3-hydroxy acid dehydrogenase YdfG